ncbi:ARM repeat-containing protein [Canariomyces notabilis]|uniref:ARM repeat-containing protein n=1 Tax=Canariomyces notabilis TaxID=2074819 RepID=A0AAN6TNP9_9PEZI|nr:ARM repeat-containing protein [Canariomyces arenarius]
MSLDPPTYLASLQSNIRQRPIPWDGAVRAGTLTEEQLARIRAVDKAKKDARKQTVEADLDGYRALFVGEPGKKSVLELAAKRQDVVHYILVFLSDLLDSVPALSKALFQTGDPYQHFLPLLSRSPNPDDPIPLLTSTVLVSLMAGSRDESPATVDKALPLVFTYLSSLTKNSDAGLQDIGVQEYSSLLYGRATRQQFWKQRSETIAPLIDILRAAAGVGSGDASASLWSGTTSTARSGFEGSLGGGIGLQLLYHVLLVMWQLSFEAATVGDELNDEYDIVLLYTQLLRLSPKEKTTRLLVSTLLNLLVHNQNTLLPTAVLARLPALLQNLQTRQFSDPDLREDMDKLRELLEEYTKTKTTFDEYVGELNSGHLRWSPPHRNTVFWAENARKILEYENGALIRKLADIMKKPWDNDKAVLAIACNDIGCLVREVPEKRSQLERYGLKTRVMELMGEADENVRWESLRALGGWLQYSFDTNYFTRHRAIENNLTGWVRNTDNNKVEGEAQGEEDALATFLKAVDKGPRHAHVVRLDKEDREVVEGEEGFEIRR